MSVLELKAAEPRVEQQILSAASPKTAARLDSVEFVRGLAALAVLLFHFTKSIWPDESIIRQAGSVGWAGVESFFVISGFIIPYAMHRSGYRLDCFFKYLAKRYLRLVPAYVASILLALVLWWAGSHVPGYRGSAFQIEPDRILSHLVFANDILGLQWLIPVFWTLAIEFQYYVAMGLIYPLLFSKRRALNVCSVIALGALAWVPASSVWVCSWSLVFLVGILLAQWRLNCISTSVFVVFETAVLGLIFWHHDSTIFLASAMTLAVILAIGQAPSWGIWLGTMSYAIYLTHVPIGGRVINLGMRFVHGEMGRWCLLLAAIAVSFAGAWLLWMTIERPALAWSSRIKYRTK